MPGHEIEVPRAPISFLGLKNIVKWECVAQDPKKGHLQNLWQEWASPLGWSPGKRLTLDGGKRETSGMFGAGRQGAA